MGVRAWSRLALLSVALVLLVPLAACKKTQSKGSSVELEAKAPKTAECAACSMVVREQPAPRGQLVHRDGTRRFLCSLADLVQYMRAPSKHGKAKAVFVEVLSPGTNPKKNSAAPRPWVRADRAHFVVGVARSGVMGTPALAYRRAEDAAKIAKAHGGRVVSWAGLAAALAKNKRAHRH